ncbi:hypothetical protein KH5H1_54260 [Corallococcus caeni]|nr:hypothetical protein KH5H1_54260 [Corallococcus sp. KH5-1]
MERFRATTSGEAIKSVRWSANAGALGPAAQAALRGQREEQLRAGRVGWCLPVDLFGLAEGPEAPRNLSAAGDGAVGGLHARSLVYKWQ